MSVAFNPVAIQIGPVAIYWYGIFIALSFILGIWVTRKNALSYGINDEILQDLIFKLALTALIGARLGVVVVNLPYYLSHPSQLFARPGMGSHGAIIATMVLGYFFTKRAGVSYGKLADAISPAIPIAHVFVRMGNFINGELYGPPTTLPWGVQFPTTAVAVHPSQLYEVLASLIILPLALKWAKSPKYPGYAFIRVLLLHSVVRFFLDFIRQHTELIGPFVLTQIIALIFSLGLLGTIWLVERKHKRARKL